MTRPVSSPRSTRPLRIGLTGGIGSGKSIVANLFERRGVPVFDADEIARALVARGQPAYEEIIAAFGHDVLSASGDIDRARLRERIFAAPSDRARLESILHPRIRQKMDRESRKVDAPYCLFVIPLLVETGQYADVDKVLVIDAPEEMQVQRVVARSGLGRDQVQKIMGAQASRAERRAHADDVIVNDRGIDSLEQAVEQLHAKYSSLAKTRRNS